MWQVVSLVSFKACTLYILKTFFVKSECTPISGKGNIFITNADDRICANTSMPLYLTACASFCIKCSVKGECDPDGCKAKTTGQVGQGTIFNSAGKKCDCK